ncbi:unnamed protein product, partial [Prorocentrum cordatum]
DPASWFAVHLVAHAVRAAPELRQRLAAGAAAGGRDSVLTVAFRLVAPLGRAYRSGQHASAGASLCAALRLVAEWCDACPDAVRAVVGSPATLPELIALLEAPVADAAAAVHVRGLAALALGTCLLELAGARGGGGDPGGPLDSAGLMQQIASRVGVDAFTRAGEALQGALAGARGGAAADGGVQRYDPAFASFAAGQFRQVQDTMVKLWLAQGTALQGMAADVAEHFKDGIPSLHLVP